MTQSTKELTTSERGKHAELLAATALLSNGYSVMEPISPQPYDYSIRCPATGDTHYVQVKTAFLRDTPKDIQRYGRPYLRVAGAKSNGDVYLHDEVDYFIAIWRGNCYMFPNREISEYWINPEQLDEKWTKLSSII